MAINLVAVGAKITAAITNAIIVLVNAQGQTSIIPTSVTGTGVSVGAAGKVTLTAATSASVNVCFTSTYDNYLIQFDFTTSAAASPNIVLRAAGTDSVAANYDAQQLVARSTTALVAQALAGTSWPASGGVALVAGRHVGSIRLYGPALAVATAGLIEDNVTANPMTTSSALATTSLLHRLTSAFDGFTISVASGNVTGNLRVYGYNNN